MNAPQPISHGPSVGSRLIRLTLPVALGVGLVSAGLGYWWLQRGTGPAAVDAEVVPVAGAVAEAPDQATDMLARARAALQDRRLLAPAGDNAVESYLALLAREPEHRAARQALIELVPLAGTSVKASIAAGDFAEAQRQYQLMVRMGAGDSLLATLRASLEQAQSDAEALAAEAAAAATAAADAARIAAAAPAAEKAVDAPATARPPTTRTQPTAASTSREVSPAPVPSSPPASEPAAAVAAANEPAPAATAPAPSVQEARQIVDVRPAYPASARQRRAEGWVELEALVGIDGNVEDVTVVRSEPARIFDREAVRAAQRWRFEPRRENGVAVASRVRKTVSFRLGTG